MLGKINVLKFDKKKNVYNFDKHMDDCFEVVEVGKHKFALRDFKLQIGHDDSLPYSAVLYDNGKPLCSCLNDGWGGLTELKPTSVQNMAIMASIRKAVGEYKWNYMGFEHNLTLEFIADTLAESMNIMNNKTLSGRVK